ncbi:MAG TPA: DUF480 domain-containing protein [Phycisphaerae bacterium]|nr:DUF480 domain-containing protein [Phycisphaerae bacterium]
MPYDLKPDEIRVLGVLIEKSLALPEYYPMTINAIVAAANQKNNRDPVTELSESQVSAALSSLRRRGLADQAPPEKNSRSIRFQHMAETKFGWNAAQRAIMGELMIRGPQTLGEIRAHASRMTHLESTDYARDLLGELERADPPLVVELERETGKRERRFAQLLGGQPTHASIQYGPAASGPAPSAPPDRSTSPPTTARVYADPLESRIADLEKTVADLTARLTRLEESP